MQDLKLIKLSQELLKCKDCDVELADLTLTLCPYANEVYDTHVWVQICDACFCERQKAIKNGKVEVLCKLVN